MAWMSWQHGVVLYHNILLGGEGGEGEGNFQCSAEVPNHKQKSVATIFFWPHSCAFNSSPTHAKSFISMQGLSHRQISVMCCFSLEVNIVKWSILIQHESYSRIKRDSRHDLHALAMGGKKKTHRQKLFLVLHFFSNSISLWCTACSTLKKPIKLQQCKCLINAAVFIEHPSTYYISERV